MSKIVGIKMTHDASIAGIDGNELVFCTEMEKVGNLPRYTKMPNPPGDFIGAVLEAFKFEPDKFVVDGWKAGRAEGLKVAGYHEFDYCQVGKPFGSRFFGLPVNTRYQWYNSYPHMAGHILGAYCTSPWAVDQEPAYVITWDGGQNPRLHYVDPRRHDGVFPYEFSGSLFELYGIIYGVMAYYFGPYKDEKVIKAELWDGQKRYGAGYHIPGKIMSYIALGKPDEVIIEHANRVYSRIFPGGLLEKALGRPDLLAYNQHLCSEHEFCRGIYTFVKAINKWSDADVLASIHEWLKRMLVFSAMLRIPRGSNVCFAGGSALNIKWNSALRNSGHFNDVWVPPFPNDSGSGIGAAVCEMVSHGNWNLKWNVYSGPGIGTETAADVTSWEVVNCPIRKLATILVCEPEEPIVFLNGRAELGPRALGNRSIFCNPTVASNKDKLNAIKQREPFRPVAPICREEDAPQIFNPGTPDPYMLFDHEVREFYLNRIPAVVHLDGTARLQTVSRSQNFAVHELLTHFQMLSGYPLLCNTSANLNGSGFFPNVDSALKWGKTKYVWASGRLYIKK